MTVRVIDSCGTVLMPTRRLGKVRHLLDSDEAEIFCYLPFTIKLKRKVEHPFYQRMTAGVDCGFRHVGISVSTEKYETFSGQFEHRSCDIKRKLEEKSSLRSGRRYRKTRYRKARFDNRISSKKEGWIPPTSRHMIESHSRDIELSIKYLPVIEMNIETGEFDTQKMRNPDIESEEYQQGLTSGFENAKAFVRWRDGNRCRNCNGKSGDKKIEVHHIHPRKSGGTNHPNNLVCLCHTCHTKHHNEGLKLKNFKLDRKTALSMRDAAAMNITADRIVEEVRKKFPSIKVNRTFGYITKMNRIRHGIPKSHTNDALVISGNFKSVPCEQTVIVRQVRRHNRQLHKTNPKKGVRRSNQAAYLVNGFALNDYVEFEGKRGFISGRMTCGFATVKNIEGEKIHEKNVVSMKRLKLIRHSKSIIYEFKKKD